MTEWAALRDAYGSADQVPALLATAATSGTDEGGPWDELWALLCHQGTGLLADLPARLAQVGGDPRRTVCAAVRGEDPPDRDRQLLPPCPPRRGVPVAPLVEQASETPNARQAEACGMRCSTLWAAMNPATASASSHPRPRGLRCA
jgi:hypothetical protein